MDGKKEASHFWVALLKCLLFCIYFSSSLLKEVITKAVSIGRKFRVIIADGRPRFEGKEMARHMINLGLHCTYILVSSVPYIINEVKTYFSSFTRPFSQNVLSIFLGY